MRSPALPTTQGDAATDGLIGSQSYNYSIPLASLPGRAGLDLNLALRYNSRVWDVNQNNATVTFNTDRDFPSYGFRLDFGYVEADSSTGDYILTEADGTKHELALSSASVYDSLDGSHIEYNSSSRTIQYPNGLKISYEGFPSQGSSPTLFRPTQIADTNGNYISISYVSGHDQNISAIVDTLGREIDFNYNGSSQLTSLTEPLSSGSYTLAAFNWGTTTLTYSFSSLTVKNTQDNGSTINVLTRCTLADGTHYDFAYGGWGIVTRIDHYSNTGNSRGYRSYDFPSGTTTLSDAPGYSQETVSPDGSTTYVWTYSVSKSNNVVSSTTVTDPAGTVTLYSLLGTSDPCAGALSYAQVSNGSTTLRRLDYSYDSNCEVSAVVTTLSDSGQKSQVSYTRDANGNVTNEKVYDWGPSAPGGLIRETATTYGFTNSSHILNLPTLIVVKNGSGTAVSRTVLAYDERTPTTQAGGGTPTHHNSPGDRGNLTSVTRYTNASAPSGAITRSFYYDVLGNMISAQLGSQTESQWNYSSTTQWAYPDSIVQGPSGTQLTNSFTYDFYSGLVLTSTDTNSKVTHYHYEGARRLDQVERPDDITFDTSYDDSAAQAIVTQSTSANSLVHKSTFDGLGRTVNDQTWNGASQVSRIDYQYDGLGRRTHQTNPYPSSPQYETVTSYDALGRAYLISPPSGGSYQYSFYGNSVTATDPSGKARRSISDALGRLAEVDEPTLASSISITGSEQSHVSDTSTHATGSVTVEGYEQMVDQGSEYCAMWEDPYTCIDWEWRPNDIYDSGRLTVIVNGHSDWAFYDSSSTPSSIATDLVSSINSDSGAPVTASRSGATVYLTSKATGSSTNYSLSVAGYSDYPGTFSPPSFDLARSGANLTGGTTSSSTTYDTGSVSVTVNSFTQTVNYNSSDSTASIASNIAAAFNGATGSPVSASASGNVVSFDATTYSGNSESVSVSSSTNYPQYFTSASYSASVANLAPTMDHTAPTLYAYRATGELTGVTDGPSPVQSRGYAYDDAGRQTSMTLPESGTTQFSYYDFGGVYQRTDARGAVTTYSYDGLHRLTQTEYTTVPSGVVNPGTVTLTYGTSSSSNNVGRLYQLTDNSGSETYTYDSVGRVTNVAKVLGGVTYNTGYSYNNADQVTQITYPSGRTVGHSFDGIGRVSGISTNGSSLIGSFSYNAAGQPTSFSYGNGVAGSISYNDHLQVASLGYSNGAGTLISLTYSYLDANSHNNGQITGITDTRGDVYSTDYTYDPLGRLAQAKTRDLTSANTWCLSWSYDRYGNRLSQSGGCGGTLSVTQPQLTVDPATNRISMAGYAYDSNGNLTNDSLHTYVYDTENRIASLDSGSHSYTYDGNGLRVKKDSSTVYLYAGTTPIAEYAYGGSASSPQVEYIYSDRGLLATVSGGTLIYHHPDQLSNRVETDGSASTSRTFGHLPFGDAWYETGTADKWKFTSYERDSETSLDYAIARHYTSRLGRFVSPDLLHGSAANPQSLNRYTYVLNDPIGLIDPLGLCPKGYRSLTIAERSRFIDSARSSKWQDWAWGNGYDKKSKTIDCSNFVYQNLRAAGIDAPYVQATQIGVRDPHYSSVNAQQLGVGDLIQFANSRGTHLAISTKVPDATNPSSSFVGSQTSTGPAEVFNWTSISYWSSTVSGYYEICVPVSSGQSSHGGGGGGSETIGLGGLYIMTDGSGWGSVFDWITKTAPTGHDCTKEVC